MAIAESSGGGTIGVTGHRSSSDLHSSSRLHDSPTSTPTASTFTAGRNSSSIGSSAKPRATRAPRACASACIRISPIGTSPAGADTGRFPNCSCVASSVGAPPDPYSATGQNWGLAAARSARAATGSLSVLHQSAAQRFRHAGALRIDHVIGLFRLFWIPDGYSRARTAPTCAIRPTICSASSRWRACVTRARRRRRSRHRSRRSAAGVGELGDPVVEGVLLRARGTTGEFKPAEQLSRALARDGEHARHAGARWILDWTRHRRAPPAVD